MLNIPDWLLISGLVVGVALVAWGIAGPELLIKWKMRK